MKCFANIIVMSLTSALALIASHITSSAQNAYAQMDVNNISARIYSGGELFKGAFFEVPSGSDIKSIYVANLWIGGKDANGQIHLASQQYNQNGRDYWPGPVMDSSQYNTQVALWDKVWKINRSDVEYHKQNWQSQNYTPAQSILDWPAHGDTSKGQAWLLAPFYDRQSDGLYDPYDGDYPIIRGDQTVFFIFNDDAFDHTETGGEKLKIEVHAMAYVSDCNQDSSLENSLIVHYEVINRSNNTYDSTYFGEFVDFDLGCYNDDYVGCDVQRGSFYGYNGDYFDEDCSGVNGYGNHPAAQAAVILAGPHQDADGLDNAIGINAGESLNGTGYGDNIIDNERLGMSRFIYFNNSNGPLGDPTSPIQYYYYLQSVWKDGTSLLYGGNGHISGGGNPNYPAKFMFPADSDPLGWGTGGTPQSPWDEITSSSSQSDRRGLGVSGPFTFQPGQKEQFDIAFVFGRDYQDTSVAAGIDVMNQWIDSLRSMFVIDSTPCLTGIFSSVPKAELPGIELSVFPNPAFEVLHIRAVNMAYPAHWEMFDYTGRLMAKGKVVHNETAISLAQHTPGIYFIRFSGHQGQSATRKFIISR